MKPKDFEKFLSAFNTRQAISRSPIVAKSVIRKFGGGRGRDIKTLYITYSGVYRDGSQVPANAWMGHVCEVWNDVLSRTEGFDGAYFEVDHQTVKVAVKGKTLKVSANMVEKE